MWFCDVSLCLFNIFDTDSMKSTEQSFDGGSTYTYTYTPIDFICECAATAAAFAAKFTLTWCALCCTLCQYTKRACVATNMPGKYKQITVTRTFLSELLCFCMLFASLSVNNFSLSRALFFSSIDSIHLLSLTILTLLFSILVCVCIDAVSSLCVPYHNVTSLSKNAHCEQSNFFTLRASHALFLLSLSYFLPSHWIVVLHFHFLSILTYIYDSNKYKHRRLTEQPPKTNWMCHFEVRFCFSFILSIETTYFIC